MQETGELSPEEWARVLALRPKVPLTGPEIDSIRKVLEWFEKMIDGLEARRRKREAWTKLYPVIFGAIGAVSAIGGIVITMMHLKP